MTGLFGSDGETLLSVYRSTRPYASPNEIAIAIESAAFAGAGSTLIAERKAALGRAPVFAYVMTDHINAPVPGTNHQTGAMHAMDMRLKFDTVEDAELRRPSLAPEEKADDGMAARNMSRMWAAFARTSQPAAPGQPAWPAYDLQARATMMIAAQCHVAPDPHPAERRVWAEIG